MSFLKNKLLALLIVEKWAVDEASAYSRIRAIARENKIAARLDHQLFVVVSESARLLTVASAASDDTQTVE